MKIKRMLHEANSLSQRTEIIFSLTFSNKSSIISHFILFNIYTGGEKKKGKFSTTQPVYSNYCRLLR